MAYQILIIIYNLNNYKLSTIILNVQILFRYIILVFVTLFFFLKEFYNPIEYDNKNFCHSSSQQSEV